MSTKEHQLTEDWLARNCDVREGGLFVFSVTSSCRWPTILEICRSPCLNWIAMLSQDPAIDDPPDHRCAIAVGHPQTTEDVVRLVNALRGQDDGTWRA